MIIASAGADVARLGGAVVVLAALVMFWNFTLSHLGAGVGNVTEDDPALQRAALSVKGPMEEIRELSGVMKALTVMACVCFVTIVFQGSLFLLYVLGRWGWAE